MNTRAIMEDILALHTVIKAIDLAETLSDINYDLSTIINAIISGTTSYQTTPPDQVAKLIHKFYAEEVFHSGLKKSIWL